MNFDQYQTLSFSREGRILTIAFNRPDVLNAVNRKLQVEAARALQEAAADPGSDVIILTGEGKAFSAGGDVQWMQEALKDPNTFDLEAQAGRALAYALIDCPKPIIARINGDAVGLGATLALLCDIIIAADHARIGDPHVRVGLVAGDGGAVIWPQLIGFARAKEYLLLGDLIDAPEAARIGLINRSVPAEQLDEVVNGYARRLAEGAQMAIRYTKTAVNLQLKQVFNTVFDAGIAYEGLTMASPDHAEAVQAFLEKRRPRFGRKD